MLYALVPFLDNVAPVVEFSFFLQKLIGTKSHVEFSLSRFVEEFLHSYLSVVLSLSLNTFFDLSFSFYLFSFYR